MCSVAACAAHAQEAAAAFVAIGDERYAVRRWTTDSGLPANGVLALAQTPDGYLWVATEGGLARFDGARFVDIDVTLGGEFSGALVDLLSVDGAGTLWARLIDNSMSAGALLRLVDGDWEVVRRYDSGAPLALTSTPDGALWFSNFEGAGDTHVIRMFQGQTTRFDVPGISFDTIACTASGDCWVGTNAGAVARISGDEVMLFSYDRPPAASEPAVTRAIAADSFGRVWFGTDDGLHVWNGGVLERHEGRTGAVLRIEPTATGALWISGRGPSWEMLNLRPSGSEDGGIVETTSSLTLATSRARAMLEDIEGNLWVGLANGGIVQLRRNVLPPPRYDPDNSLNPLAALAFTPRDAESAWLVESCRVWLVGPDGVRRQLPEAPRDDLGLFRSATDPGCVVGAAADSEGSLWFLKGRDGATRVRDDGSTDFTYPPDAPDFMPQPGERFYQGVRLLTADARGRLWYVRQGVGIVSLSPTGEQTVYPAPRNAFPFVQVLRPGIDGELWYLGWDGFGRFADGEYEFWSAEDWFGGAEATDIHIDPTGAAWVASDGGGVLLLDGQHAARLTRQEGLSDERILHIVETDAGDLWLGSRRGLTIVSRDELVDYLIDGASQPGFGFLGPEDGVPGFRGLPVAAESGVDGRIWLFGGVGVVVVDPEELSWNDAAPQLLVEGVHADGVLLAGPFVADAPERIVVVPAGHRGLEIRYTVATFEHPDRVRFRYRIEEQDSDWIEGGNGRVAAFSNLWPGDYVFRVAARKNFGPWSERTITLRVLPLWWQTLWFFALATTSLVGAGAALQGFRTRALKRRNFALEREVSARMAAEVEVRQLQRRIVTAQEDDRARIARDLHDDISQRLYAAAMGIDPAIEVIATGSDRGTAELHALRDQLEAVAEDARKISHELHPSVLRLLGLGPALAGLVDDFESLEGIEATATIAEDLGDATSYELGLALYRITQEALRNVAKHAGASRVVLEAGVEAGVIRLIIRDDGQGFDVANADSGLGLASMRERAGLLNGTLHVDTRVGAGTELLVELPNEEQQS